MNDPFRTSIKFGGNCFGQGGNLRDAHNNIQFLVEPLKNL